ARDGTSEWAAAARTRLAQPAMAPLDPVIAGVLRQMPGSPQPEATDLQALREFVEQQLLPRWAGAADGSADAARGWLSGIRAIADRLAVLQGDGLLKDAVDRVAAGPSPESSAGREGFICYARVRELYRTSKPDEMGQMAGPCTARFAAAGSPYVAWTR